MKGVVFYTNDISPNGLLRIYKVLNRPLKGSVAVKISSGEPGGHNYLQPVLIEPLVTAVHGTIVECNTAYLGNRTTTEAHWEAIRQHGFDKITPCDIMNADGGNNAGGGSGYDKNGIGSNTYGGGGAYGPGGDMGKNGVFGGGGGCESLDARNTNCWGGNGICIISYYGVAPE